MKNKLRLHFALVLSAALVCDSFGARVVGPTRSEFNAVFQDTAKVSHWKKLKWDLALGFTGPEPYGQAMSTSVSYPLLDFLDVKVTAGLVTFRGPQFDYYSEYYYNSGLGTSFQIDEYTIADYAGIQSSVAIVLTEPIFNKVSVSVAPYYLSVIKHNDVHFFYKHGGSTGWDDETNDILVNTAGTNYGNSGITNGDFGFRFGAGYQHSRWGFWAYKNIGFVDWGDNQQFGNQKETVGFNTFQVNYLIKK